MPRGGLHVLHVARLPITMTAFLIPLLRVQRAQGYRISMACSDGPEIAEIEAAGFAVYRIALERSLSPVNLVRGVYQLTQVIRRARVDWVFTHTPIASAVARLASRLAGAEGTIYMAHGLPCAPQIPKRKWLTWYLIERALGQLTDGLITMNRYDYELTRRHRFVRRSDAVFCVPGVGVDAEYLDALRRAVNPASVKNELTLPTNEPLCLLLARTYPSKGIREFLEAARRLVHKGIGGSFVIGGRGPLDGEIPAFIEQHGLQNRVRHLGWRRDAHRLLAACDIYVLPTYYPEGLPVSILEAMACGKAVIATRHRGCEDAVLHEVTGLLVPPRDPMALARAIRELIEDPKKSRRFGEAGRIRIEACFRSDQATHAIASAFEKIVTATTESAGRGPFGRREANPTRRTNSGGTTTLGRNSFRTPRLGEMGRLDPARRLGWYDYAEVWLNFPLGKLLDYGCGTGMLLERIAGRYEHCWAVDVDPGVAPSLRSRPDISFQCVNPRAPLPFADGQFDTVVCVEVIEHVANERRVLAELARVLRPGGRMLITTPHQGLLTFADPGNFKFLVPCLHRFIHCHVLRQQEYYENRFGSPRAARGMIADFTLDQSPWHRHYSYTQLRRLVPPNLETLAWAVYYPAFRLFSCLEIAYGVVTFRSRRTLPRPVRYLARRLSRVRSLWGDQLIVLLQKKHESPSLLPAQHV